jgi:hypothetical protein
LPLSSDRVISESEYYTNPQITKNLYFESRDSSHLLWRFPKLTFYESKNFSTDSIFIVKGENIFRCYDRECKSKFEPDTFIKHIGFARRYGTYCQIELRPIDNKNFQECGKWYATFHLGQVSLEKIITNEKSIFGWAGGVSKYQIEEKPSIVSAYIFNMRDTSNKDHDTTILNTIKSKITVDYFNGKPRQKSTRLTIK